MLVLNKVFCSLWRNLGEGAAAQHHKDSILELRL